MTTALSVTARTIVNSESDKGGSAPPSPSQPPRPPVVTPGATGRLIKVSTAALVTKAESTELPAGYNLVKETPFVYFATSPTGQLAMFPKDRTTITLAKGGDSEMRVLAADLESNKSVVYSVKYTKEETGTVQIAQINHASITDWRGRADKIVSLDGPQGNTIDRIKATMPFEINGYLLSLSDAKIAGQEPKGLQVHIDKSVDVPMRIVGTDGQDGVTIKNDEKSDSNSSVELRNWALGGKDTFTVDSGIPYTTKVKSN